MWRSPRLFAPAQVDKMAIMATMVGMMTVPATDAKNRFGELLDTVHREPVEISKKGRVVAVMLSVKDYEEMRRPTADAPRNEFRGLRAWIQKHKKAKTGKPLDEDDYHKHLLEKYGK